MSQFGGSIFGQTPPFAGQVPGGPLLGQMVPGMIAGFSGGTRVAVNPFNPFGGGNILQDIEARRYQASINEALMQNAELGRMRSSYFNQFMTGVASTFQGRPLTDQERASLINQGDAIGGIVNSPIGQMLMAQVGFNPGLLDPTYGMVPTVASSLMMSGAGGRMSGNLIGTLAAEMAKTAGLNADGSVNPHLSRGFTASQYSMMAKVYQSQGLIGFNFDDEFSKLTSEEKKAFTSGDTTLLSKKIAASLDRQLGGEKGLMADAANVFGTSDPNSLFGMLSTLSGGRVTGMSPEQVRSQLGVLKEVEKTFQISLESALSFIGNTTALAQSQGLSAANAAAGALSTLTAAGAGSSTLAGMQGLPAGIDISQTGVATSVQRKVLSAQNSRGFTLTANAASILESYAAGNGVSVSSLLEKDTTGTLSAVYDVVNGKMSSAALEAIQRPGSIAAALAAVTGQNESGIWLGLQDKAAGQRSATKYPGLATTIAGLANMESNMKDPFIRSLMNSLGSKLGVTDTETISDILGRFAGGSLPDLNAIISDPSLGLAGTSATASKLLEFFDENSAALKHIDPDRLVSQVGLKAGRRREAQFKLRASITSQLSDSLGGQPVMSRILEALNKGGGLTNELLSAAGAKPIQDIIAGLAGNDKFISGFIGADDSSHDAWSSVINDLLGDTSIGGDDKNSIKQQLEEIYSNKGMSVQDREQAVKALFSRAANTEKIYSARDRANRARWQADLDPAIRKQGWQMLPNELEAANRMSSDELKSRGIDLDTGMRDETAEEAAARVAGARHRLGLDKVSGGSDLANSLPTFLKQIIEAIKGITIHVDKYGTGKVVMEGT